MAKAASARTRGDSSSRAENNAGRYLVDIDTRLEDPLLNGADPVRALGMSRTRVVIERSGVLRKKDLHRLTLS